MLAALGLPPAGDRLRLGYLTLVNGYFSNVEVAAFLEATLAGLSWPEIVLWDRGTMHQGDPIRTLLAQSPKVSPYRLEIRRSLAQMLGVTENQVNIKATTTEHLGFIGRSEGLAAQAVVLLEPAPDKS